MAIKSSPKQSNLNMVNVALANRKTSEHYFAFAFADGVIDRELLQD
jgi:hypothetical protein